MSTRGQSNLFEHNRLGPPSNVSDPLAMARIGVVRNKFDFFSQKNADEKDLFTMVGNNGVTSQNGLQ